MCCISSVYYTHQFSILFPLVIGILIIVRIETMKVVMCFLTLVIVILTITILVIPIWLVVSTPLKNMSSSMGMMTFPTEWKNEPVMFQSPPTSYTYYTTMKIVNAQTMGRWGAGLGIHIAIRSFWGCLVGAFNPLKHISQLGWLFPVYGKIKHMFQTTNQISIV